MLAALPFCGKSEHAGGPSDAVADGETDGTTDSGQKDCLETLDQQTLDRLVLAFFPDFVQLMPGQSHQFRLGVVECCYFFESVDACATWWVEPDDGTAQIDQQGLFIVDEDVPNGTKYTVRADVDVGEGRRIVSVDVYIYTPEDNPFVGGIFTETEQIECGTGDRRQPEQAIGELWFLADGSFTVTWMPFEVYVDYWGEYTYDLTAGTLALQVSSVGNYIPDDIAPEGFFEIAIDGSTTTLTLDGIWLGTPSGGSAEPGCGHVFVR